MSPAFKRYATSGWGISLIAGFFLTILAPYDTGRISLIPRFLYWSVLCLVGAFGAAAFIPLARRLGFKPGAIGIALGQSLLASFLITSMLAGWNIYQSNRIDLGDALVLFLFVWTIAIVITAFAHLTERATHTTEPAGEKRPALFERLKPSLRRAEIYALMAEDHYVRVFTSNGEDLILMRLSDAVKELGSTKGLPVHRSWWVAETGIKSVKKSEGKISLELHSGQIAPVSRSNAKLVKQAGWVS